MYVGVLKLKILEDVEWVLPGSDFIGTDILVGGVRANAVAISARFTIDTGVPISVAESLMNVNANRRMLVRHPPICCTGV